MEPINFLLSVILIIILVLVIRLNVKTNEVSWNIDAVYNEMVSRYNSLYDQYQAILSKFNKLLKQQEWITDFKFEIRDFTEDKKSVNVRVSFSIKEKIPYSKLYLVITSTNENNWQKVLIEDKGYLSYIVDVELPLVDQYTIDLLEETDNYKHRENITFIDLINHYKNRLEIITSEINNNTVTLSLKLKNYGVPSFKLKNLSLLIVTKKHLTSNYILNDTTVDVTDFITIEDFSDYQIINFTCTFSINPDEELLYIDPIITDYCDIIVLSKPIYAKN